MCLAGLVNTNLAAAAGVIAALAVSRPIFKRMDLITGLNGAIGGLVAITAGPDFVDHYWAIPIGAVGGAVCTGALKGMEMLKVDDVVGAIPAHLVAGIWGTLAVPIASGGNILVQLVGVVAVGAFAFSASWLVWRAIDMTIGVRVSRDIEELGQDAGELGIESYPEFILMPEQFDEDEEY